MGRTTAAWAGFWAGFAILDLVADSRGRSLCTSVRWAFRSTTPAGRVALAVTLDVGYGVLRRHLLK